VSVMTAIFELELLDATIAAGGLLVLLAAALGAFFYAYVADEEAKGRRIEWLVEPLAMVREPVRRLEAVQLPKAA